MEIIRHKEKNISEQTAVALGNFDGLHTAHMKIINACKTYAIENGLKSGVMLFESHTLNLINGNKVDVITPQAEKINILNDNGIDFVYCREFDEAFMKLSPEEFAVQLKTTMNVSAVFVGYDYRFGYRAEGDAQKLTELGKKHGFNVTVVDKVEFDGEAVKSSRIRKLVCEGEIEMATHMLGRMFSIAGNVERGFGNGRKLGVPTANVSYQSDMLLPGNGVYGGYTTVDGIRYKSVINVGNNPTFGAEKITVESHIIDFCGDIYDNDVTVEFAFKIRNDIKFKNIDELVNQIRKDIEQAKIRLD